MTPLTPSSTNNGIEPVKSAPLYQGASSHRESSMMFTQANASKQNDMNKTLSGGKRKPRKLHRKSNRRKNYKGGNGTMIVPSFYEPGPAVSSGSQSATGGSITANIASTQGVANAACDKCIGPEASTSAICQGPECNPNHEQSGGKMKGGSCTGAGGLIPNGQTWGCLSGGAKKSKKSRKSKK